MYFTYTHLTRKINFRLSLEIISISKYINLITISLRFYGIFSDYYAVFYCVWRVYIRYIYALLCVNHSQKLIDRVSRWKSNDVKCTCENSITTTINIQYKNEFLRYKKWYFKNNNQNSIWVYFIFWWFNICKCTLFFYLYRKKLVNLYPTIYAALLQKDIRVYIF